MKDITIEIENETYKRIRMIAEEHETSVENLIRDFLCDLTSQIECEQQEPTHSTATDEENIEARRERFQKFWDMADPRAQPGPARTFSRKDIYNEGTR